MGQCHIPNCGRNGSADFLSFFSFKVRTPTNNFKADWNLTLKGNNCGLIVDLLNNGLVIVFAVHIPVASGWSGLFQGIVFQSGEFLTVL